MRNTKCWFCSNKKNCEWIQNFKEVDGWVAEPSKVYSYKGIRSNSYCVIDCPNFKEGNFVELSPSEFCNRFNIDFEKYLRLRKTSKFKMVLEIEKRTGYYICKNGNNYVIRKEKIDVQRKINDERVK